VYATDTSQKKINPTNAPRAATTGASGPSHVSSIDLGGRYTCEEQGGGRQWHRSVSRDARGGGKEKVGTYRKRGGVEREFFFFRR
jgi:hypothetical protein